MEKKSQTEAMRDSERLPFEKKSTEEMSVIASSQLAGLKR